MHRARAAAGLVATILIADVAAAGPLENPGTRSGGRPTLSVEGVITNPDWAQRPSGEQVAAFYPQFAQVLRLPGRAKVGCVVTKDGGLTGCAIQSETPTGFGFGAAALKMSAFFKMKPLLLNGEAVSGGRVVVPIAFKLDSSGEPADGEPDVPATTGVSTTAMALARSIADVDLAANSPAQTTAALDRWRDSLGASATTPEAQLAFDGYERAVTDHLLRYRDYLAGRYASSMSEPMLSEIAKLVTGPAGRKWIEVRTETLRSGEFAQDRIQAALARQARTYLCSKITCVVEDAPNETQSPGPAGARTP